MHELILGGQKSGKSRTAELRARTWLTPPGREAALIATAQPLDEEMADRIARHQSDRKLRVPQLHTIETPDSLADTITRWSRPNRLLIVDCLTLWLTQLAMPLVGPPMTASSLQSEIDAVINATQGALGPVIFVSNEIGLGVAPISVDARRFVDSLGLLHQAIAATCDRVTLMVAGCELPVRAPARG